ncbi:MAG: FkbM family methyltransferase [Bacteriovoracaceae bacterium]|nr:FkbM family methyltransferase [Bacteriovoracaceae bacterium]
MFKNSNLLKEFYSNFISKYKNLSFSQEGEDRVLMRFLDNKNTGFYIDIGAHHPFRFSNTYAFYRIGWRGINIEANPDAIKYFNFFRKKDINLNVAIGHTKGNLKFFKFNEPALNSFDEILSNQRISDGWSLKEIINLRIYSLEEILDQHLPKNQNIDFMTIDVEGLDLDVLKSNNWVKYRPNFILVECLNFRNFESDPINVLLKNNNYEFVAKTLNTVFFKNSQI